MQDTELLVVGGGPAGSAAALTAAELGVETLLVDENPLDPVYLQRNVPHWYGSRLPASDPRSPPDSRWLASRPLLQQAAAAGAEVLTRHAVWGTFPGGVVGVYDGTRTWLVHARQLVFATGATDLPLAFSGWTLAGVLGGGGALHLLDLYGRLDARRMVILGAGNLGMTVARRAMEAGVAVAGIVEIEGEAQGDAALYDALAGVGVPFFLGHTIKEARGDATVAQVILTRVREDGTTEDELCLEADTLCVAIGQQPAIDLAYLSGCAMAFDATRGGFFPRHDRDLRTSQEGIFVAGDLAGALDAAFPNPSIAEASGRLAAVAAVAALGRAGDGAAEALRQEARAVLDRIRPTARSARDDGAFPSRWHRVADALAADDLVLCRCEDVTRGAVLAAMALAGGDHPEELKRVSRAGMGLCQGRGCRPLVAGLLGARTGRTLAELPVPSYRPPVRSLPLEALATEEERPLPRLRAFDELEERLARDVAAKKLSPVAITRFHYRVEEMLFTAAERGAGEEEVERLAAELERQIRYAAQITE